MPRRRYGSARSVIMTCDDDAHPISAPVEFTRRPRAVGAWDDLRPSTTAGPLAPGVATALRSLRFRLRAAGVGARAGHRLRFSLPAGSDRLAQRTRSGGRSVPCRRVHSLSVVAARKLRSRLLRRPQTVDSAPPSSASNRCLRRRNVASSPRRFPWLLHHHLCCAARSSAMRPGGERWSMRGLGLKLS